MKQSSSQARGCDYVPQYAICAAFLAIGEFILEIFNKSIRDSVFHVSTTPRSLCDLRLIALLCFLSKILERLIHNQIYDYLKTRKFLILYQSGYRKGHSTQSALIKLIDDIRVGMDRKHITTLLLFDFSKVFDTVCHVTLLRKLRDTDFSRSAQKLIIPTLLVGNRQLLMKMQSL